MWRLDPAVTFLNHGSFGACPRPVMEAQHALRETLEREPVRFLSRELEARADAARAALASFVGADPDDLAFVTNATSGVNTVLRSLTFAADDEILTTDHGYNACRNAVALSASASRTRVTVARVPFPLEDEEQVVTAVMDAVTPRTRLAVLDHITVTAGRLQAAGASERKVSTERSRSNSQLDFAIELLWTAGMRSLLTEGQ